MFQYHSDQTHFTMQNGKKSQVTEHIHVKNGKGSITVIKIQNGKKVSKKHPLTYKQIKNIQQRKFMPGLFRPCLDHCDKALGLPLDMTRRVKKSRLRNTTRKIHTK
jgi:hypothetical protein